MSPGKAFPLMHRGTLSPVGQQKHGVPGRDGSDLIVARFGFDAVESCTFATLGAPRPCPRPTWPLHRTSGRQGGGRPSQLEQVPLLSGLVDGS